METTRLSTKWQILRDTELAEVAGCLRSKRKSGKPAAMRAAVDREVLRRHDRGRY